MQNFSTLRLCTPRLELHPLEIGDETRLFEIYSDPEFMRYWSCVPWTEVDQGVTMIRADKAAMESGEYIALGIYRQTDQRLVGTCCLFKIYEPCRRAELGYGIARDSWRRGYMTEAISALMDYGFVDMGLNRLEADVDPRNTASCRSLENLGFVQEGLLRQRWIAGKETSDSAIYGLLASDWRNRDHS